MMAAMTAAMTTDPAPAAVPVGDLTDLIGHYLSVRVTYLRPAGNEEHVEFVGLVTAVHPLVAVSQPGSETPFTLPPDPKNFRAIPRSAFAPETLAETALSPRFETRWRVRAPMNAVQGPAAGPYRPKHA
jgi:hypothetical protein